MTFFLDGAGAVGRAGPASIFRFRALARESEAASDSSAGGSLLVDREPLLIGAMVELNLGIGSSCEAKREGSFDWTESEDKSERVAEAEPLRGPAYDARRGDAGTSTRGTLDMGP